MKVLVTQLCPPICDPTDWSPPGSSGHGILQERILAWVATLFSSVAQLCPTLCDPMNRSMPGFPVHDQPGVHPNSCPLSWWCHPTTSSSVIPFSSCHSLIQDQTQVSCIAGGFFTVWATREAHTWTKENVISIWGKFRISYYISFINDIKRADKIFLTSIL